MSTLHERASTFREEAQQDYPTSWRPDEGAPNPLVGEVVRYDEGPSEYGTKLIIVVRDDDGQEWSVWAIHAALLAALRRERPKPGELIFIHQEGKRTSKASGRSYTAYKVKVDREVVPDFDQLAIDAEAEEGGPPESDVPADADGLTPAGKEEDSDIPF